MLLRTGLRHRPAAVAAAERSHLVREAAEGLRIVAGDRRLYGPLLLGIVGSGYVIVPEAIAPAYAQELAGGPRTVGLIMAAVAGGSVLGGLVLARLVRPAMRRRLMWPLAMAGTVPLMLIASRPPLGLALTLLALAGLASAYQVAANTSFAAAAPGHARARVFGIAMTGMFAGQGLAIVLAGAGTQVFGAQTVIAGSGVLGAIGVGLLRPTLTSGSHRAVRSRRAARARGSRRAPTAHPAI